MVQINGKYESYKTENLVEFIVASGLSEEFAKAAVKDHENLKMEFQLDGNKVVVHSSSARAPTTTYILDGTADEVLGGNTCKTTSTLNGDVLTATAAMDNGKYVRSFKFDDTGCVLTLSSTPAGNMTAKRFFKRV